MSDTATSVDDTQAEVLAALRQVAPDADPSTIDKDADLRDACDIDSMDFLSLVTRLSKRFGVPIPESDYPKLVTLGSLVAYLDDTRTG